MRNWRTFVRSRLSPRTTIPNGKSVSSPRWPFLDWIADRNIGMIRSLDSSYATYPAAQCWSASFSVPAFREIQSHSRWKAEIYGFLASLL